MFGFAIEDPSMTVSWLESVLGSMAFWVFCSRPLAIFAKTVISKCKLMRLAAKISAKRKSQAQRRMLLLGSLGMKEKNGTDDSDALEIQETLEEMYQHENRLYEHNSSDITSPKKSERFAQMENAVTL